MAENKEEKKVNEAKEETKKTVEKEVKKETKKEPVKKEAKKETVKKEPEKAEKKDDNTFRKVESQKVKKESKHGFLKAVLVIIGILVIAYLVFVIRNYVILNKLYEKAKVYKDATNYTYHATGPISEYTAYVKDGTTRVDMDNFEDDSKDFTIWADENTEESIMAFPNQKVASKNPFSSVVVAAPFDLAQSDYLFMNTMLFALITSDEFDGKDCYVLNLGSDYILRVDKATGLVVKRQTTTETMEFTNIEVNNVDEIYKPDLTGYTVNDNTENETVEE